MVNKRLSFRVAFGNSRPPYVLREGCLAKPRRARRLDLPAIRGDHLLEKPEPLLSAACPFVFAILWASSYAAAKIGLADITPYAFVAVRLGHRGGGRGPSWWLALKCPTGWSKRRWQHLLIGGALVHGLALATAHWPHWSASPRRRPHWCTRSTRSSRRRSAWSLLGERFVWWQWLGFALGLAGVVLGVPHDADFSVMALLGLSLFGLSAGTLYLKKFAADVPPFEATAVQLDRRRAAGARARWCFFETPHVHLDA